MMMYARVLMAQTKPGKTDELIQIIRDSVIPEVKQEIGFKGLLLVDQQEALEAYLLLNLWYYGVPDDLDQFVRLAWFRLSHQHSRVHHHSPFLIKYAQSRPLSIATGLCCCVRARLSIIDITQFAFDAVAAEHTTTG